MKNYLTLIILKIDKLNPLTNLLDSFENVNNELVIL